MPDFCLQAQCINFVTELNIAVNAWRTFGDARFETLSGFRTPFSCIVDTGAPFTVMPFSLWHDRQLRWLPLGSSLTRQGKPDATALDWQGVPCTLGLVDLFLVDALSGVEAGPFMAVGKSAQQRHARAELETIALLGLNFLTDNAHCLRFDASGGTLTAFFSLP